MKRLALLVIALAVLAPSTASAAVPCRTKIYNDWLGDGKIATTYPIACYRDALAHVHTDAAIYSSLKDDIRAAMQGALARLHGHTSVPAEIGKGATSGVKAKVVKLRNRTETNAKAVSRTLPTTIATGSTSGGSGGGVPTPILVLGALALLLAAIGAVGTAARRRTRRG